MQKKYTILVPRADRTGPTNVAVDIGKIAIRNGWNVRLLFMNNSEIRDDLVDFSEVRRIRLSDFWLCSGVVHTHGLRPDLVGLLFKLFKRCFIVSTLHGNFPHHLKYDYSPFILWVAWAIWSSVLYKYDHRVCISESMRRYYHRQFPTLHFDLVYNFRLHIETKTYEPDKLANIWIAKQHAIGKVLLIYVGSLNQRKNILALVKAVIKSENISLLVCGQGKMKDSLVREIVSSEGGSRVFLAGHVDNPDDYIKKSHALVLPSFSEGLPLVIIEACKFGVPSLLSNIAVHKELARIGVGEIFDHHNFNDFEQKVMTLYLNRSELDDEFRRILADKYFGAQRCFEKYEEIFKNMFIESVK